MNSLKKVSTKGLNKLLNRYIENSGIKLLFRSYYQGALRKNLYWQLDPVTFQTIISGNCFYCGSLGESKEYYMGEKFKANGIDRIDNKEGYYPDNCRPACKLCNKMKSDLDIQEFLDQCQKITQVTRDGS